MPDIVHRRPDLREFVRRDPVLVIACALALAKNGENSEMPGLATQTS